MSLELQPEERSEFNSTTVTTIMHLERSIVEAELVSSWPPAEWRDVHVVLAVSGGPDSVAMLRAAVNVKQREGGDGRLYVAHLNHGLRGADAAADQAWLADLCRKLNVPLELGSADVPALACDQGDGCEAAARAARYEFLVGAAEKLGARWIAIGHTADDQVETVLHRLVRGSGLAGLAGMPRIRPLSPTVSLVRPLLSVWRRDMLEYLKQLGQNFRTDVTNCDPKFTRNRLRHELLPKMRAGYNADVDAVLLRLARQAEEAQEVIAAIVAPLVRECVVISGGARPNGESGVEAGLATIQSADRIEINCRRLAGNPALVIREVCKAAWSEANWPLQDMGFDQWQLLAGKLAEDPKRPAVVLPGGIRATRAGSALVLQRQRME